MAATAASSSLMGPTGMKLKDSKTSGSCSSSTSSRRAVRMRVKRVEAVMTASSCESVTMHGRDNVWEARRDGLAAVAAFDYRKMMEEEEEKTKRSENENDSVTVEMLDEWIRNSVGEIVRNIGGESPFLMQIFSKGPPSLLRLEASPENWPSIKKTWEQGTSCMPDGVILVKQLNDDDDNDNNGVEEEEEEAAASAAYNNNSESSSSKRWGLLVQGRGMDCAAASCYILNTCRVGFCTHFCLVRAKCFGDSLDKQLNKAWLLQGR